MWLRLIKHSLELVKTLLSVISTHSGSVEAHKDSFRHSLKKLMKSRPDSSKTLKIR